ncbi:hypothetical protein RR46_02378 [Papilio xuthus]|uniref:Uncharacterized protein n=1 Tax=Papilio xuthus TaxID=66420 RepID=A0A194Q0T2_PAPXU|nr:hypothetical protein RR46_02378 [Papilio xuthus]
MIPASASVLAAAVSVSRSSALIAAVLALAARRPPDAYSICMRRAEHDIGMCGSLCAPPSGCCPPAHCCVPRDAA